MPPVIDNSNHNNNNHKQSTFLSFCVWRGKQPPPPSQNLLIWIGCVVACCCNVAPSQTTSQAPKNYLAWLRTGDRFSSASTRTDRGSLSNCQEQVSHGTYPRQAEGTVSPPFLPVKIMVLIIVAYRHLNTSFRPLTARVMAYFLGVCLHLLHLCLRMHRMATTPICNCSWEDYSSVDADGAWIDWVSNWLVH